MSENRDDKMTTEIQGPVEAGTEVPVTRSVMARQWKMWTAGVVAVGLAGTFAGVAIAGGNSPTGVDKAVPAVTANAADCASAREQLTSAAKETSTEKVAGMVSAALADTAPDATVASTTVVLADMNATATRVLAENDCSDPATQTVKLAGIAQGTAAASKNFTASLDGQVLDIAVAARDDAVAALEVLVADAALVLDWSNGQVTDEATRVALETALAGAKADLASFDDADAVVTKAAAAAQTKRAAAATDAVDAASAAVTVSVTSFQQAAGVEPTVPPKSLGTTTKPGTSGAPAAPKPGAPAAPAPQTPPAPAPVVVPPPAGVVTWDASCVGGSRTKYVDGVYGGNMACTTVAAVSGAIAPYVIATPTGRCGIPVPYTSDEPNNFVSFVSSRSPAVVTLSQADANLVTIYVATCPNE